MKEEELVKEIRRLLLEAKKKESELRKIFAEIGELSSKLKNHKVDLDRHTIHEISRGGP